MLPGTEAPRNVPGGLAPDPKREPPVTGEDVVAGLLPKLNRPPVGFGGSLPSVFVAPGYVGI